VLEEEQRTLLGRAPDRRAVITLLAVTGLTHRQAYGDITETLNCLRRNSAETSPPYIPKQQPGKQGALMEELFEHTLTHRSAATHGDSHIELKHRTTKVWTWFFDVLASWIERYRQCRELESLPDYMLKDIGVSRSEAWTEAEKPFWRA
jgi:uncharacterized protein YjiS (DUF1127 family)